MSTKLGKDQIELDDRDIERVANKVIDVLKPLLKSSHQKDDQEIIMDVDGWISYLKVTKGWVYGKISLEKIYNL